MEDTYMSEIEEIDAQIEALQKRRRAIKLAELNAKRQPYIKRWGAEVFDILDRIHGFGEVKMNKLFTYDSITVDKLLEEFPLLKKVPTNDLNLIIAAVSRSGKDA